ncbi:MAG: hypothetical protein AB8B58_19710, partial [Roseobacter sp.]
LGSVMIDFGQRVSTRSLGPGGVVGCFATADLSAPVLTGGTHAVEPLFGGFVRLLNAISGARLMTPLSVGEHDA